MNRSARFAGISLIVILILSAGGCRKTESLLSGVSKGKQGEQITLHLDNFKARIKVTDSIINFSADGSVGDMYVTARVSNVGDVPFRWQHREVIADDNGRVYAGSASSFLEFSDLKPGTDSEYKVSFFMVQRSARYYFCAYEPATQDLVQFKIELTPKIQ
ncbi:hypothetical protein KJ815_02085 [bacterium]|nr:hypothetical protein [bacterium]